MENSLNVCIFWYYSTLAFSFVFDLCILIMFCSLARTLPKLHCMYIYILYIYIYGSPYDMVYLSLDFFNV